MARGDLATLVRICDPAGRTRGTGFLADDRGTVVTSHETVDGLAACAVHAPGGRACPAGPDAITSLPAHGLALIRTEGLGVPPLPIARPAEPRPGGYVRIAAHGWREARVQGPVSVTYRTGGHLHVLRDALGLALGTEGAEALLPGGGAAGGPVLDPATGAVLAVLGTTLRGERPAAGYAVPLATAEPLSELLRHNAATVPCHGRDLNLAGVLELTATATAAATDCDAFPPDPADFADPADLAGSAEPPGPAAPATTCPAPVERAECARRLARFTDGPALVLAVVGVPGSGRTTALAAHCARRARGTPAPTVWLRGADLRDGDDSVADAVGRALGRASRVVAASGAPGDVTTATPQRVAALAREAGRPLLIVLDGPEEMPPGLAQRLTAWTTGTGRWLRAHGARLVLGCRPEHWEQARPLYPPGSVDDPVPLGDLTEAEARTARRRYGLGDAGLAAEDARHPLALRLLAEVRRALPGEVPGRPGRDEILTAYLDLKCLRTAVRIAAGSPAAPRGAAVRRLAAKVSGRVHEAARRSLGPGQGALDRESFEELFPWRDGWARAVLTEGIVVPAGDGYRFGHEEVADWLQGAHLDVDAALRHLAVPGPAGPGTERATPPVPRHRVGPVLQALLLLARDRGPEALLPRLEGLARALDRYADADRSGSDEAWWAARLLAGTLLALPDPRPCLPVLRLLADLIGRRRPERPEGDPDAPTVPQPRGPHGRPAAGSRPEARPADGTGRRPGVPAAFARFGPSFWEALRVREDERVDLLRRLVTTDPPCGGPERPARYLDTVAARLAARPRDVQPLLCRWFGDGRPLAAAPHATVATAAQALLHTHRSLAVDDLCEALIATAHPLAEGLLTALAEDEPSALCRAVDRWAHDDTRPDRRAAAARYGALVARHVTAGPDRELLRYAALALLARHADPGPHGPALGLLVRDPVTRGRHLPRALAEPSVPADALAAALVTDPELVITALRERLDSGPERAGEVLRALAEVTTPALARQAAALVRDHASRHPEDAERVAAFVDRRLEHGPAARAVLFPLATDLLLRSPGEVRCALAPVVAAPGTGASRLLRTELLDVLLRHEQDRSGDPRLLDALLRAAAADCDRRTEIRTRDLVRRTGLLLVRTPAGATRFDRRLSELAREVPRFAALMAGWLQSAPDDWAVVVGPSTRRTVVSLGSSMPMRTDGREHGSLRPA
ncbi:trypsin-like peptidase domain-containing protein [Streptomyces sp. NPDC048577]|uniref:trypsin-like peptidase domain-containing protein n=1 Tax=Streptomyces sp. NPDC048577 TaxID=3157209 RepID=UPI00342F4D3D